jgi:hypothetical protein
MRRFKIITGVLAGTLAALAFAVPASATTPSQTERSGQASHDGSSKSLASRKAKKKFTHDQWSNPWAAILAARPDLAPLAPGYQAPVPAATRD